MMEENISKDINENLSGLAYLKANVPDLDTKAALQFCAGSEEFYQEILGDFAQNESCQEIEELYSQKDWKEYEIKTHSLKGISRTLGFVNLGNIAEKLQRAAEKEDEQEIDTYHQNLMKEYANIIQLIKQM